MFFGHNLNINGTVYSQAIGQIDACGECELDAGPQKNATFIFYDQPTSQDTVTFMIKKY